MRFKLKKILRESNFAGLIKKGYVNLGFETNSVKLTILHTLTILLN